MSSLRKIKDAIKRTRSPLPAAPEAASGAAPTASTGDGEPMIDSASDCDETSLSLREELEKLNLASMYSRADLQWNLSQHSRPSTATVLFGVGHRGREIQPKIGAVRQEVC
jgi:hypothetical protein